MEFLAILLGIAGGIFIVWLLYKMINAINHPKNKTLRETVSV